MASLSKDFLDVVACPKCKQKVTLASDQKGFVCDKCRLVYAIVDGLPNFLVDDAKPL